MSAARRWAAAIEPFTSGVYVNDLADEGEAGARRAYSPHKLARLATLKQHYDRDNRLHPQHNTTSVIIDIPRPALDDGTGSCWGDVDGRAQLAVSWCHGSTGMVRFLLAAYDATETSIWRTYGTILRYLNPVGLRRRDALACPLVQQYRI
jgi:hypothetical protein